MTGHLLDSDIAAIKALREKREREAWRADFGAGGTKRRSANSRVKLVMADNHVPDEHVPTWRLFLRALQDIDPHGVVLYGDFLDLESLNSRRPSGKDIPDLGEEYDMGRRRLIQVGEALARADRRYRKGRPLRGRTKEFFEGNHERRFARMRNEWPRHIRKLVPDPQTGLGLDALGWTWVAIPYEETREDGRKVTEQQPVWDGELCQNHGMSFSKHYAAKHLDDWAVSMIVGHAHRCQQIYRRLPDPAHPGKWRVVCSTGLPCACNPRASWVAQPRFRDWVTGFGVVEAVGDYRFVYPVVVREDPDGTSHAAYGRWRWSVGP